MIGAKYSCFFKVVVLLCSVCSPRRSCVNCYICTQFGLDWQCDIIFMFLVR